MSGNVVGLAAVVMIFAIPLAGIWAWAWQRGRKLRADERLVAIGRGLKMLRLSRICRIRRYLDALEFC